MSLLGAAYVSTYFGGFYSEYGQLFAAHLATHYPRPPLYIYNAELGRHYIALVVVVEGDAHDDEQK